jgi:hypothetical protein
MLHVMSTEHGWSHDEMMRMSRRTFLRYYGYWYAEQFNATIQQEWEEAKNEAKNKLNQGR